MIILKEIKGIKRNLRMNLQIPFEILGHYKSMVLSTDDTFYQLVVRYPSFNITITLNDHEIESYSFKNVTIDGNRKVKKVLPLLIEHFEKLGYKDAYKMEILTNKDL